MKKALILTLVLALPILAQHQEDKKAVLTVINQLFTEMAAANPEGILALHTPTVGPCRGL